MSGLNPGVLGSIYGVSADTARKHSVWCKGTVVAGYDPAVWRCDAFGYFIKFDDYGLRTSEYGWEIDHIHATILGGADEFANLRPLHHRNNASLGGVLGGLLNSR